MLTTIADCFKSLRALSAALSNVNNCNKGGHGLSFSVIIDTSAIGRANV